MEHKSNIDNFERFLRDKTDEFRLYPSKRVWYSIYNNMHPGNRMPSISMCIVLLFSLLTVGYLHTNTSKDSTVSKTGVINQTASVASIPKSPIGVANFSDPGTDNSGNMPYKKLLALTPFTSNGIQVTLGTDMLPAATQPQNLRTEQLTRTVVHSKSLERNNVASNESNTFSIVSSLITVSVNSGVHTNIRTVAQNKMPVSTFSLIAANQNQTYSNKVKNIIDADVVENDNSVTTKNSSADIIVSSQNNLPSIAANESGSKEIKKLENTVAKDDKLIGDKKTATETASNSIAISETDKAWIENYASYNRPAPKKWAGKISWQAYITPSVVYRTLHNNAAGKDLGNNTAYLNTNVNNLVTQKPSFGAEMGMALQYDVLKRVKLKAGVQLNYTRYNTHGFDNFHPITTSLAINNDNSGSVYEVSRTTPFSNAQGLQAVKLHNETYQISVPVGIDLKLVSLDNISWYVGATLQPTVIVYGRSYLISTDQRNYVPETSMLNRFNLNAGFETYISFKTNNYTWQVGPQFRSQLFSTNSKTYSIEERLQNYGFKIGVSKKL